jgi:co-chaperonin GroES (HSP10)
MDREALAQMYGVVIAMGDSCYADQVSQWCKVGDRVSFGKYTGLLYTGTDEQKYRMINDLDVVGLVEEGVK